MNSAEASPDCMSWNNPVVVEKNVNSTFAVVVA